MTKAERQYIADLVRGEEEEREKQSAYVHRAWQTASSREKKLIGMIYDAWGDRGNLEGALAATTRIRDEQDKEIRRLKRELAGKVKKRRAA